jgi:hypothetical protein
MFSLKSSLRSLLKRRQVRSQRQRNSFRTLFAETLEDRRVMAAFTPGNLLVLQADDSSAALGSAVSLVEVSPTGTIVQTILVSSTGADRLTVRGSSTTEGALSISADGQWVTFGGTRAVVGTDSNAVGVDRAIGRVDANGVVNTTQSITDAFQGDSLRSVATNDGNQFWLSGAAGTATNGGLRYVANTTDTTTTSLMPSGGNSRQVQVLDGNLFISGGSAAGPGRSVFQVGTGLPTSGSPTFTNTFPVAGSGPQYQSYYFADLNNALGWNGTVFDTLYSVDTNGTAGGVDKWTFNGGAWVNSGVIPFSNMANIIGFTNGSSITLYGATKETNGKLVTITDTSGYNGTFSGSWGDLATPVAATGTAAFRGITRVPELSTTQLSVEATDATKLEGNSGPTIFTFTVNRTAPLTGTSSANWSVTGIGGSPANAADFTAGVLPSGTVSFGVGETSKTILVSVNGDVTNEPNEGFRVTLSGPVGATLDIATADGLINNDDAATELDIVALSANKAEGTGTSTSFTFTVNRTGTVAGVTTTVSYSVLGSGASPAAPDDFDGGSYPTGQVTFNPGQTSAVISIPVSGDTTVENNEGFTVTLSNPTGGAGIIGFTANGTIINDDSTFVISPASVTTAEGNSGPATATFTVTRTGDLTSISNVAWSTAAGSSNPASANDFVGNAFPSGTLNFLANEVSKSITVDIAGDNTLEANESYVVTLNSASIGTIVTPTANGIILNDDFQSLNAGDIVITSIFSDNPDAFSFVPLVDLIPNSSIVFTDNAWNGTALLTNEGTFTYTAPSGGLTKGTKVAVEYDATSGNVNFLSGTGSASVLGNFGLSTDGDSLLAYVGIPTAPNFLFAVTTFGEYVTSGTPNTNQTHLPSSLSIGSTAVDALGIVGPPADEVDNAQYIHASGTAGTPSQIRALVANRLNWNTFDLPTETVDTSNFTVNVPNATVVGRNVFYNRSFFNNGVGNPTTAIDTSKSALLPGQTTTTEHYTNSRNGLNGIVVDISNLSGTPTAADFQFATWNGIDAAGFVATASSPTVEVFAGGGNAGSSRVKLDFADNAIRNVWLRVTVLANANTGLANNDVFYFGNAVGDMQVANIGTPITVRTNASDTSAVRQNQSPGAGTAGVTSIYDLNKDGRVNASDTSAVRQNQNPAIIRYFTAPLSLQLAFNGGSDAAFADTSWLEAEQADWGFESDHAKTRRSIRR